MAASFARVRKLGGKLPDVEEGTTYGYPALKTGGKVFAWMPKKKDVEPETLAVRMSIFERDILISSKPDVFYITPHYKDYSSVLVRTRLLADAELKILLESAHEFMRSSKGSR
ncbi:MAG TPA: MmcQ/YjbR family DNA-binding protein [Gemmatimonadaceae bacterium]|nr:MmcQ/YjbR family DNA-binding protein [Gemmatimonadaceae bacterium]